MRAPGPDGQDLAARYEELRAFVLGDGDPGRRSHGLALLLRQGLAAWIAAWQRCATPPLKEPDSPRAPVSMAPGDAARAELARVLAGMALEAVRG